jgi:hypothetical protein
MGLIFRRGRADLHDKPHRGHDRKGGCMGALILFVLAMAIFTLALRAQPE